MRSTEIYDPFLDLRSKLKLLHVKVLIFAFGIKNLSIGFLEISLGSVLVTLLVVMVEWFVWVVRAKKTFESCGVRLKLCRMYPNVLLFFTCYAKSEFSKRKKRDSFLNRLKRKIKTNKLKLRE